MANEEIEKVTIRVEAKPDEASATRSGDAISKALSKSIGQLSKSIDEMSKRMEKSVQTSTSAMTKGMDAQFKTLSKSLEDSLSKGVEKGLSKAGITAKEHVKRMKKDAEEVAKAVETASVVQAKGKDMPVVTKKDARNHTYKAQAGEMRTKWGEAAVASTGAYEELLTKGAHKDTMKSFQNLLKIMELNDKEIKQGFLSVADQFKRAELSTALIQFRDSIGGFGKDFKKGIPPANWGVEQFESASKQFPKWDTKYKKFNEQQKFLAEEEKIWALERKTEQKYIQEVNKRIGQFTTKEDEKPKRPRKEPEEKEQPQKKKVTGGYRDDGGEARQQMAGVMGHVPGMDMFTNLFMEGSQKGFFRDIAGMFKGGSGAPGAENAPNPGTSQKGFFGDVAGRVTGVMGHVPGMDTFTNLFKGGSGAPGTDAENSPKPGKGLFGELFSAVKGPSQGTSMAGAAPKGGASAGAGAGAGAAGGAAGGVAAAALPVAALLFIAKGIMDVLEKIFQMFVKSSAWMGAVMDLLELGILHVIRPMADAVGQWLMPYIMKFAERSLDLYKKFTPKNGEKFDTGGYVGAVATLGVATLAEFSYDTLSIVIETLVNMAVGIMAWLDKVLIDIATWILKGMIDVAIFIVVKLLEGIRWVGDTIIDTAHNLIDGVLTTLFIIGDAVMKIADWMGYDTSDYKEDKSKVFDTVDTFFGNVRGTWDDAIFGIEDTVIAAGNAAKTYITGVGNDLKTEIDRTSEALTTSTSEAFEAGRAQMDILSSWLAGDIDSSKEALALYNETKAGWEAEEQNNAGVTHGKITDIFTDVNSNLDTTSGKINGMFGGLNNAVSDSLIKLTDFDDEVLETIGHITLYSHGTGEETEEGQYRGYATGGIAWTPQTANLAETEPELITPFSQLKKVFGGQQQSSGPSIVFNHYGNIYGIDDMDRYMDQKLREYDMRAW